MKMQQMPTVQEWLQLDFTMRAKLANAFGIGKSGYREMVDNKIVSDGTTQHDLKSLNVGAMIAYLGEDCPFFKEDLYTLLFTNVINKLNNEPTTFTKPEAVTTGGAESECAKCKEREAAETIRGPKRRRAKRHKEEASAVQGSA